MSNEIPARPVIGSPGDLELAWRLVMTTVGWTQPSLWVLLIDPDGHPRHQVLEFIELDGPPTSVHRTGLTAVLADLGTAGLRVAFLRARPGRAGITEEDRAWAEALASISRAAGLICEPIHLADEEAVLPLPAQIQPIRRARATAS